MIHHIPVEGKWRSVTDEQIMAMRKEGNEHAADAWEGMLGDYEKNRLSRFLPHGIPWSKTQRRYAEGRIILPPSEYKQEYGDDGVGFMNDRSNPYIMLLAPRKVGKSYAGAAKICVESLNCDPNWPIFTENKVKYKPFEGPTTVVIASFSWANVGDIWKVYQELMPRNELGPYAPQWGKYEGEGGAARYMSFGDGRPKTLTTYYSGTEFVFLCYTQQQHVWESFKAKYLHADEQIKLGLLRAWEDGSSTYGDHTPAIFTLSGYVLDERPEDTGAAGPLKGIWDGRARAGKTVGRYNIDVPNTPDVILSPSKKQERFDRYVNKKIARSEKDERRGLAVYYPGWEPGSGLAFGPDVWLREVHVINPLWEDAKVPRDWTKWRVIDYADTKTTCCSWWAVGPKYAVLYRLLYEPELLVAEAARKIIEMSHNKRVEIGQEEDERRGSIYKVYEERQTGEQFYTTLLDSRAASWKREGVSLLELFQRHGITDISPASGQTNEVQIPALKDWLRIDYAKDHPFRKNEKGEPVKGCPRLFFFDGLTEAAIDELETVPSDPKGKSVINQKFPHDFIDTGKYWASDDPQYFGNDDMRADKDGDEYGNFNTRTPFTGY